MMKWIARNFAGGHGHSHSTKSGGDSHSPAAEKRDRARHLLSAGWTARLAASDFIRCFARSWLASSRPRWFRCDCSSRTHHDSRSGPSDRVPAGFRDRYCRWNDVITAAIAVPFTVSGHRFRQDEPFPRHGEWGW